ncbi:hypothetical protein WUBG_18987, partial [Wuchereria bancrofti]
MSASSSSHSSFFGIHDEIFATDPSNSESAYANSSVLATFSFSDPSAALFCITPFSSFSFESCTANFINNKINKQEMTCMDKPLEMDAPPATENRYWLRERKQNTDKFGN